MRLNPMDSQAARVKVEATRLGFHRVGIVAIAPSSPNPDSPAVEALQAWLAQGYQASMDWMADERRRSLFQLMPEVRSVICLGLNYYTPQARSGEPGKAKISRYGWGRDYHKVMTKRLKAFRGWLEAEFPGAKVRFYVDTGPVQEKAWAQQAGIGWIGKHSNVISRDYGSWLFLGEVLTSIELAGDRPHLEHCGTCTRCLEACPTGAIVEPFVVDANRCIAYHTIENRAEEIPGSIAAHLEGWVAGCDICQDVCPWNQRFAQPTDVEDFYPYPENVDPDLEELANLSWEEWDQRFRASALRRINVAMMRRNAWANLALPGGKEGPDLGC
jgi:epoxyqueuosine reductase